ncbi:cache domain-containing sensor histidine kinase [Cellulosilyticum ruminicola]|uniref:cache domain-containing sensor histidine kinase n=1 Tax=Cellulosilyticum ruminicola TaxID=425254 RepID=UPI0006D2BB8F|nr:sensor histidine kinase [Cellulosilyticum ruminicola]
MQITNRLFDSLKNLKVKNQLIGMYISVVIIPVLILGSFLTNRMCNMVIDRAINEASINTERIKERMNETIKIASNVADRIYVDDKIRTILTTKYESTGEVVAAYNTETTIEECLKNYSEIQSIKIYVMNETLLSSSKFTHITDEVRKQEWYQNARLREDCLEWEYKYDEVMKKDYLALIRAIHNKNNGLIGVLVININPERLQNIIKDEPYDTLIAVNQEIIETKGNREILENQLELIRQEQLGDSEIYKMKNGKNYIILNAFAPMKTKETSLEICMNMSIKSITRTTIEIIGTSLVIMAICIVLTGVLIDIFSRSFSERIILVKKEMHKVVMGDFNIRESIEGHDEIGELYTDIYATVQEIYRAKVQKEELKRHQKEVEFEMLARQINPHFLYNTLETIRMKAYCNGQKDLARVVKLLSKLMRRNLEVTEQAVVLKNEVEMMVDYLEIQKFRFGSRISYKIEADESVMKLKILPLIIQPLVENAFVHGLESKIGEGKIVCSIKADEEMIITVEDNGLGIDEVRLKELKMQLEEGGERLKGSFGLYNINQRIKLYYGKAYGMHIISTLGKGTKVTVNLPKIIGG